MASTDFDARLYGHKKLSELVKSRSDLYALDERNPNKTGPAVVFVRLK